MEPAELARRWYDDIRTRRDIGAVDEIVHPDFVQHYPGGGTTSGPESVKQFEPQTPGWYDRLAGLQEGYYYAWSSHLPARHGEDVYAQLVREYARPDVDVLDVACGHGEMSLAIATQSRSVLGYDRTAAWIELARRRAADQGATNVRFVRHDSSPGANGGRAALPAPDDSFDLLICSKGPWHWADDARRVARPGARLIMLVPNPTPVMPWTGWLPAPLAWTDPNDGNPLSAYDRFGPRLQQQGISLDHHWTFVVPETFARPEDLYRWRAWGYTPDEVPSFDDMHPILERIFEEYGGSQGVAVPHSRFLWMASVPE